ncbi:MAG: phosphopantetheine-binding protein [Ferruginibacter sp.]
MKRYIEIIQNTVPEIDKKDIKLPFENIGIDSIDLVTIRVDLEKEIGKNIPDSKWVTFENLYEIIGYCSSHENSIATNGNGLEQKSILKEVTIDMPQMAIEALSENWLFKELGNLHWQMLCDGLGTKSFDLKDELDNRLYATFVRISINSTVPLNKFKENETLSIDGKINRYGNSMYFSNIILQSGEAAIDAHLMTSFSIRNASDNTKLVKSQPGGVKNSIHEFDINPAFGNEYRLVKKGELNAIRIGDIQFEINNDCIFETPYNLNPYYDLNGVGLLYFAAYPIISDVCEAKYFNALEKDYDRWELAYYTLSRDIFYYGNCNVNETVLFKLHAFSFLENDMVQLNSSLHRKSDNSLIARIFTVKKKRS